MLKKSVILSSLLLLTACKDLSTPAAQYYTVNQAYVATLKVADGYMSNCFEQPKYDKCYDKVDNIQNAVDKAGKALEDVDQVFLKEEDSPYRSLAIIVANNAIKEVTEALNDAK